MATSSRTTAVVDSITGDPPPAVASSGAADIVVTLPAEPRGTKVFKLAFGSCHKNKYADAQIWKTIASETVDGFLWTGDAIYPPVRGIASLDELRDEYQRTRKDPRIGYSDFLTTLQQQNNNSNNKLIFGTWDDHDYGGNDRGNDMPQKKERAALFYQFLGLQDEPFAANASEEREGVYYSVEWRQSSSSSNRRVKAIFLDTRWFRQPHCIPSVAGQFPLGAGIACVMRWLSAGLLPHYCAHKELPHALLGAAQWDWLEAQITDSGRHHHREDDNDQPGSSSVLIVVSSIQVLSTNPVMESWGHFPAERRRLVELLMRAQHQWGLSVVLLSGDVHHAELLDPLASTTTHPAQTFVEVTSSGLTHDCSAHIYGALCRPLLETFHRHRYQHRKNYYIGRNYGTIHIDWDQETVQVAIHDVVNGTQVLTTGARPMRWNHGEMLPATVANDILPCMDGHLIPVAWTALWTLAFMVVGGRILLACRRRREQRQKRKKTD